MKGSRECADGELGRAGGGDVGAGAGTGGWSWRWSWRWDVDGSRRRGEVSRQLVQAATDLCHIGGEVTERLHNLL